MPINDPDVFQEEQVAENPNVTSYGVVSPSVGYSLTNKFTPRIRQKEKNLFIEEYYSSTDVTIYLDGIEQKEIGYISYSLQEQLKPLYGYASRTFDDVAVGNRIVTGVFKTPIKNVEANSTIQDVIGYAANEGNLIYPEDYNKTQEDLSHSVEWIDNRLHGYETWPEKPTLPSDDPNASNDYILQETEEDFDYRNKLMQLGYDLSLDSPSEKFQEEIKKFQDNYYKSKGEKNGTSLGEYGVLTDSTKRAIDERIQFQNSETNYLFLKKGTKLYMGVSANTSQVATVPEDMYFHIVGEKYIDVDGKVWYRVSPVNVPNTPGEGFYESGYYCIDYSTPKDEGE